MTEPTSSIRPFVIGITGNIACGKSTVLRWLAEWGAKTIDADQVYHELIAPGSPLARQIIAHFGPEIALPNGGIDRRALGARVFADPYALEELERLAHPAVVSRIRDLVASADADIVAIDAVKLLESSLASLCDVTWLVVCNQTVQLERLMTRNKLSREAALQRIRAQPDPKPKMRVVDAVIDNSGSLSETRRQVAEAWDRALVVRGKRGASVSSPIDGARQ